MIEIPPNADPNSRALSTLAELGRHAVARPSKAVLDQGLNALYARIAAGRVRQRAVTRWSLAGLAAAAAAVLVLLFGSATWHRWFAPEAPALTCRVEGGSVLDGGYLRESEHTGIKLLFNEGSQVVLASGTRGRLRSVDQEGARIAIENGTASFQITPSTGRRWIVESGPFLVTVKGTVFTVSWIPASERFELRLVRGRVVVSGPISNGELALRAGQRLVVSLPEAKTLITEDGGEEVPSESSSPPAPPLVVSATSPMRPPEGEAQGAAPSPPSVASANAASRTERRWAEALASGKWDRILDDVDRAGVDATLNEASSEDLFALANAARYRRRVELARSALLAERRRFPNSSRAVDATFLLGRVEESRGGAPAQALAWYDEYLHRAPAGAYAAEALGRKMTVVSKSGDAKSARSIAEEYLRRFPTGSYAGSARALLEAP